MTYEQYLESLNLDLKSDVETAACAVITAGICAAQEALGSEDERRLDNIVATICAGAFAHNSDEYFEKWIEAVRVGRAVFKQEMNQ